MTKKNVTCKKCGYEEGSGSPFCTNCGALLDATGYSSEEVYQSYERRITRMVENLKSHPHYDILWNETLDLYAAKAEKLQSLLRTGILDIDNDSIDQQFRGFLERCRNPEFQIAFVGTIKTGKSTLINALLGHNYASMAVTPETAALTKFRSSEQDYINVTFFSKAEWEMLWKSKTRGAETFTREYAKLKAENVKNKWVGQRPIYKKLSNAEIEKELNIWSSSKSPEHFFVKEIEVGISSLPSDFPKQVVFVDTPGLSDPVAYRSEISKQYIKKANAVFVCVDAQKVYQEEFETISSVLSFSAHDKGKVFIVATHWDSLNNPEKDWREQRAYLAEQLTGEGFYKTREMAKNNLLHSAALIHNLCRDYHQLEKEERRPLQRFALSMGFEIFALDDADLQKLDEFSNIGHIKNVIRDRLLTNYSKLLYGDFKAQYDNIVKLLRRNTDDQKKILQEQIDATGKNLEEIVQELEEKRRNAEEIRKGSNQLRGVLDTVKRMTDERIAKYQSLIDDLQP